MLADVGALVEREVELAALERAVADAATGTGRFVAVEGVAGAGKSSLLDAAAGAGARHGLRLLAASGAERERAFAFGAVRQLLEPLIAGAAPADRLLGPADDAHAGAGFAVVHGVTWVLANAAAARPLLVAIDDLHWCDADSVRALDHLVRRLGDLPIALVVALRRDEPGAPMAQTDGPRQPAVRAAAVTVRG